MAECIDVFRVIKIKCRITKDTDTFTNWRSELSGCPALHERYDATHEELQVLVNDFSQERNPKYAKYRDIIFAMRSEVSADEWTALTD